MYTAVTSTPLYCTIWHVLVFILLFYGRSLRVCCLVATNWARVCFQTYRCICTNAIQTLRLYITSLLGYVVCGLRIRQHSTSVSLLFEWAMRPRGELLYIHIQLTITIPSVFSYDLTYFVWRSTIVSKLTLTTSDFYEIKKTRININKIGKNY